VRSLGENDEQWKKKPSTATENTEARGTPKQALLSCLIGISRYAVGIGFVGLQYLFVYG